MVVVKGSIIGRDKVLPFISKLRANNKVRIQYIIRFAFNDWLI